MFQKITCFLIVVASQACWSQSQDRSVFNGKVVSNTSDLEGIYVINAQTEETVMTNSSGSFSISAKENDVLVFSSISFKEKRVLLKQEDFSNLNFTVSLSMVMYQLQEVVVRRYDNINAESLGIIPMGQKKYTAAERKLQTATALNPTANSDSTAEGSLMAGGSISADPLLNFFSGRTAMLKKEVAVEKKEFFMKLLENMFSLDHFIDRLKIPADYVKGFEYYAIENDKFTVILNSKNKTSTEFLLGELAVKYKEMIAGEGK
ncbi:carboxypeptidase-like regulatory domain-containing protein [Flavobacterium ginsengisoli]|uniref:carboxypeptidase-like regulatory domain-containing protein n=1 Tax=Flavobacterium ginsengisoli TaxID=871694 RepID=UPI0024158E1C|nr:carboxypeptidase-like regulatory domain-containing protein [Flavobacterium ginsengisoli]